MSNGRLKGLEQAWLASTHDRYPLIGLVGVTLGIPQTIRGTHTCVWNYLNWLFEDSTVSWAALAGLCRIFVITPLVLAGPLRIPLCC